MSNSCVSLALISLSETAWDVEALLDQWVQDADRHEAAKRKHPEIARRYLLGRSLVRALIDRTTGSNGRDCRIFTNDNGKPFVALASGEPGPAISISHSGAVVAAAATNMGSLGIDVEQHRLDRSFASIAGFAFGPREKQVATAAPGEFYRIWCLREAMSKASGEGLREAVDGIDRVQDAQNNSFWTTTDGAIDWLLSSIAPIPDYSLAIAVKRPASAPDLHWSNQALDLWQL